MKKKYINPSMEVVKIETPQILAGSLEKIGEVTDPLVREFDDDGLGY